MRSILTTTFLLLFAVGCSHYNGYGRNHRPDTRGPSAHSSVPPGKILVQDIRTGRLILIDDPNARPPAQLKPPAYGTPRVAPRPRRGSPRAPRPGVPVPGIPKSRIPTPECTLSLSIFAANVNGTLAGHDGLGIYEADLEEDLDLDGGINVSLDFTMQFPRGPRFRAAIGVLQTSGLVDNDSALFPTAGFGLAEIETDINIVMFDLAFCPMVRKARWGTLSLETGFRYARSSVEIDTDGGNFSEGLMVTLGGEFDFPIYKNHVRADVKLGAGLGTDSAFFQFDTGIGWHPTNRLYLRLGYRFLGMVLVDKLEKVDERYLGLTAGGLGLEFGLKF